MIYRAFDKQATFHKSKARFRGVFSGKRSGKTECGAIESIIHTETKPTQRDLSVDPYLGVIIAPTLQMIKRLSLKKFFAYAKPFRFQLNKSDSIIQWHNKAEIHCISGDTPQRLEGVKADWIWIDEALQCTEQLFLEAQARVADTEGRIWLTSSLGVQYRNPKTHWAYKYFKESEDPDFQCFEWATADNPHFPVSELLRLQESLDPRTYRQMFTIDWNVQGTSSVYDLFDDGNIIRGYNYDPKLETYVSIDWGWTHPMACLFFQYDPRIDCVFLFDEIVSSRLTIEQLWARIKSKGYNIKEYFADISGNQEREQTGKSNIKWFKEQGINIKTRRTLIQDGITVVRSYIQNGIGQKKFYVDEIKCPKSVDGIKNYSYPEKDGTITDENPLKKDDDCVDAVRYFFMNRLDKKWFGQKQLHETNRWDEWRF